MIKESNEENQSEKNVKMESVFNQVITKPADENENEEFEAPVTKKQKIEENIMQTEEKEKITERIEVEE